jgi:hypothetical protein
LIKNRVTGRPSSQTRRPIRTKAALQPNREMRKRTSGAITRPPAAIPTMAEPIAVPRRRTNQRASTLLTGMKPMPVVPRESRAYAR